MGTTGRAGCPATALWSARRLASGQGAPRVLTVLTQMFQLFLADTVNENLAHVMRHPIKSSELTLGEPQRLRTVIAGMPADDRRIGAGFTALLEPSR